MTTTNPGHGQENVQLNFDLTISDDKRSARLRIRQGVSTVFEVGLPKEDMQRVLRELSLNIDRMVME